MDPSDVNGCILVGWNNTRNFISLQLLWSSRLSFIQIVLSPMERGFVLMNRPILIFLAYWRLIIQKLITSKHDSNNLLIYILILRTFIIINCLRLVSVTKSIYCRVPARWGLQQTHPAPIEVECGFSVVSGYLQCSTEHRLLGIFSAALKMHCSRLECRFSNYLLKFTKRNEPYIWSAFY